jgi:hypothetical protein
LGVACAHPLAPSNAAPPPPRHAAATATPRPPAAGAPGGAGAAVPAPVASARAGVDAPPANACAAPSLAGARAADARTADALARCAFERSGHDAIGDSCGGVPHDVPLARLDAAVLAFDDATLAKLRDTHARGLARGRNPRAFGLVGDSITASPKFLSPFGHQAPALPANVSEHLRAGAGTIVDWFRGAPVHAGLDSFLAPRAAKVGAPSSWALPQNIALQASPVGDLIATVSPAIVLLLYGSNDAAVRFVTIDELRRRFRARMERILDLLDAEGIIAVLHTVPRHMHDEARPDCGDEPGQVSNWRLAVQTSAVSAVAADLACERHLPLIDLRHGFDALLNHGVGPDGVHPNAHPEGAALLTPEGRRCGYNARNYLALRMLRQLHDAIPLR